jgi:hypothetical protein
LTAISSLVDSILHTLDDALLPAANWVLELDAHNELQATKIIEINSESIIVAKPFATYLQCFQQVVLFFLYRELG